MLLEIIDESPSRYKKAIARPFVKHEGHGRVTPVEVVCLKAFLRDREERLGHDRSRDKVCHTVVGW